MLVWRGPQFAGYKVAHPDGLPEVHADLVRMIRLLGDDPAAAALLAIGDAGEREALLTSLATTLTRTMYHRLRFTEIAGTLAARRIGVGGTVCSDTCSKYAVFEAAAMLTAARTAVDEMLYIAARRAGATPADADDWKVSTAVACNLTNAPRYNVAEVLSLRARLGWYSEMNEYRNVLVHRGWREQVGGFFPVGVSLPEATDPTRNVMLVPDRGSLTRVRRGDKWTYLDGTRLEHIVERAADGLNEFLDDIGRTCWGGGLPAAGTAPKDKLPNMLVILPHAALVVAGDIHMPVFASEARARTFHRDAYRGDANLDLFPVLPTTLDDGTKPAGPGYWLSMPAGDALRKVLAGSGLAPTMDMVIALDPVLRPEGPIVGRELVRLSVASLIGSDGPSVLAKVPMEVAQQLFLWRRRPECAAAGGSPDS
jgi:hypothetical protein